MEKQEYLSREDAKKILGDFEKNLFGNTNDIPTKTFVNAMDNFARFARMALNQLENGGKNNG